ncbi:MAG: aminotransferase class I/II-fold pyridoxal phosphate-dependent enzyme [Eggerthellales bacterium]|nr:aminotransferase class I/II-fold pyridoxal phosphate-dependent enzyme [Eggerthellales bacterium]
MYRDLSDTQLAELKATLDKEYTGYQEQKLSLNMARGKPGADQLDLSMPMLTAVTEMEDCLADDGTDCRNYGVVDGLPEAKALMATMLDDDPANVIVFGNSSLSIMHDTIARCHMFGTLGHTPWGKLPQVKWLCPSPGYDRHFGLTEHFGYELITVPMTPDGPDMNVVEELVANDPTIKGIWCVPKYSNPGGEVYSDETVERLASMKTAAEDFRIFWDNAYCVHYLYAEEDMQDTLKDVGEACVAAGNPDRYFKFASTSKVTFPGAGLSGFAASPANVAETKAAMSVGTIGHDKLNQLRHVKFLKDADGIAAHMQKHAKILRPKFQLVQNALKDGLSEVGECSWSEPRGGYFISFMGAPGTAKRTVELAKAAGVTMTGAGATYPYKKDPEDRNIRIAPTLPPLHELQQAMEVFVCCNKLATVEMLLAK